MKTKSNKEKAREVLRQQLWPGCDKVLWPLAEEKGWAKVPRTLPHILTIMNDKNLTGAVDLTRPYIGLLCQDLNDGVVEVVDEDELAAAASLTKKSWHARILKLEELGFIRTFPKGNKKVGYIFVVHPMVVVRRLRKQNKVQDGIWNLLLQRNAEYNATAPETEVPLVVMNGGQASGTS